MNATKTRTTKVNVKLSVEVNGHTLYATATGLRHGARGPVEEDGRVLLSVGKGDARRIRKALRKAGFARRAGTPTRREELIHPREVYHFSDDDGYDSPRLVTNPCYTKAKVGARECHSYAAPGTGYCTWLITRKDAEGVWGRKVEDTLRLLDDAY